MKSTGNKYEGVKKIGKIPVEYTIKEKPEGFYKWNEENQDWEIDQAQVEANKEKEYIDAVIALNPMVHHINMHIEDEEIERAERARSRYRIAKEELREKYGKGSKVLVTETGTCYHKKIDCSALSGHETKEINLSDGLKKYTPCSMCCN